MASPKRLLSLAGLKRWMLFRFQRKELARARDCEAFDPEFYLQNNPDVAAAGLDPFQHYLRWGNSEGRRPSSNFDPLDYLNANPDLKRQGTNAFTHYVRIGSQEGRPRSPVEALGRNLGLSQTDLKVCSERLAEAAANPAEFWENYRAVEESGMFDPVHYRGLLPWLSPDVDALAHYLLCGGRAFIDPSTSFSGREYCIVNPDVRRSGINPLVHYLALGRREQRCVTLAQRDERRARISSLSIGLDTSEQVTLERMRGVAFLFRYNFTLENHSSLKHIDQAIGDLATRRCELTIDTETPEISIVIPVYGQLHLLLNCLDSIAAQTSRYTAEVIIVDDASTPESRVSEVARIPWVRYIRQDQNAGFISSCNHGAAVARGKYLVFLNTDTRVVESWLDELIESFGLFPRAALVGSKLINADETLQEAAGIVWRDGTAWNYGRGDFAFRPEYTFARKVGACKSLPAPRRLRARKTGLTFAQMRAQAPGPNQLLLCDYRALATFLSRHRSRKLVLYPTPIASLARRGR